MIPSRFVLLPSVVTLFFFVSLASAQTPPETPDSATVSKSVSAIGYVVNGGSIKVDLKPTDIMPQAGGQAKVEAKTGTTNVEVNVTGLPLPTKLGAEFLTFVLWSVSPDGRTSNLGEIQTNKDGEGSLKVTTQLQTFSLIVTAEPYYTVRQPSEMVVLVNDASNVKKGKIFVVTDYKLMRRSQYEKLGNPLALGLDLKNTPLQVYEARNAVDIAKSRSADKYAADIYSKAEGSLKQTENAVASKANKKEILSSAKQTIQFAEDSRALSVQRQEAERIENERTAAAAKAKADAEAKAAEEAAAAKRQSDLEAQRQAELAAAKEAQMRAEAAAQQAQAKAQQDALMAKEEAAKADAARARKAAEDLRAELLAQLNRILDTTDTPRGLVVNVGDVLFDVGKYSLTQDAQLKLARLSGIVLAHPGLKLAIEGYTDSTGGDELNMKLSQQRADAVRTNLIGQGLDATGITAQGLGPANPVDDNNTVAGRRKNRRVEIIISGEVIGMKIGG
jgi:outer membrane protein OmpA-like peptidoglycan-associated protein